MKTVNYDIDRFAEITALKLGMEEEPVILWPLCGYEDGWCMSPEGCIIQQILPTYRAYSLTRHRAGSFGKCKYRTLVHPEYEIRFGDIYG